MRNKLVLPVFLIIFVVTSLVFFWFKEGLLIGNAESGLPFYNLSKQVQLFSRAWTDTNVGYNTALLTGTIPTYYFLSLFESIGMLSFIVEALFFWLVLTIACISIFFLTKELFPELSNKIAVLAPFFYIFNTYSMSQIWNRFLTNHMVALAALPLLIYLYILALKRRKYLYSLLMAAVSTLFAFAFSSISTNLILWGMLTFVTIFYTLTSKDFKEALFYPKAFIIAIIAFSAVNLWWIGPLIELNFSKTQFSAISNFLSQGNLDTLYIESQLLGSYVDTTRFIHSPFFTQGQDWAKFFSNPFLVLLEFVITGIILLSLIIYHRKKAVLMLGILFLIGLFLVKGSNPPFGQIFELLFIKFPILQVFRNPFEKLGLILILTGSILFAKGASGVFEFLQKKIKIGNFFYLITFLIIVFVFGKPFWSSEIFSSNESIPKENAKSYKIEVPNYYQDANDWLNNDKGTFRFVSLPLRGEGISYNWEKPYIGVDLSFTLFDVPNISNNTTIPYYSDFVLALSNYQLSGKLINFLPFSNIKYLLLRDDLNFLRDHMANPQNVNKNLERMVENGLLSREASFDKLSLYKVNEKLFWPKIYIAPNILVSNKSADVSDIDKYGPGFPEQTVGIIDSQSVLGNKNEFNNWLIKPQTTIFPLVANLSEDILTEDYILSRLPRVDKLPGEEGYSLSKTKEVLEMPSKGVNYWDGVVYKLISLGKRLVEIYRLSSHGKISEIKLAENTYKKEFEDISSILSQRSKMGVPIPATLQENLLIQYFLAKKIKSDIKETLRKVLLDLNIAPSYDLPIVENQNYIVYRFDIPISGEYELKFGDLSVSKMFIDGGEASKNKEDKRVLSLNEGTHEVAIPLSDLQEVIFSDNQLINIDVQSIFKKTIDYIDIPSPYQIDFDYKFNSGNTLQMLITDDTNQTIPIYLTRVGNDWSHFTTKFQNNFGALTALLQMQSNGQVNIQNLKISRLKRLDPTLLSSFSQNNQSDTTWDWIKINPTHYLIRIQKNNNNPELLVFSELFNSKWQIYSGNNQDWQNAQLISEWRGKSREFSLTSNINFSSGSTGTSFLNDDQHFLVNGYGNGWIIKESGEHYLNLIFMPQQTLQFSATISKVSLILIGGATILLFIKRRYEKKI